MAQEQRLAKHIFQLADMMADSALRDQQRVTRLSKPFLTRHFVKDAQGFKRRQGLGPAHAGSLWQRSEDNDISQIDCKQRRLNWNDPMPLAYPCFQRERIAQMSISARIKELGHDLPTAPAPAAK